MLALVRKYGLFYLTHAVTFFFLCAYSLAASAPNYPFLPALFFSVYLCSAVAMSERETDDPMLGLLPISPRDIMNVKFGLAFAFVVLGWFHMGLFTVLQGLEPHLTVNVIKLSTISASINLLLAASFQLGIHFFGWPSFHKVIIAYAIATGVVCLLFFINLGMRGGNDLRDFPLNLVLDSLPTLVIVFFAVAACALFLLVLRAGPWNSRPRLAG